MKQIIDCAYCDGQAHLQKKENALTFKKEEFGVVEHFYKCNRCEEEFTTTESDTVTLLQAQNQYREKYSIPFPDEIHAIRGKYDLSASKMSEVLGLGINGYSNYEKGEIPTPAIGNLISTVSKAEVFMTMLIKAKGYFNDRAYSEAIKNVESLIDCEATSQPFYVKLNMLTQPSSLTGYKRVNKEKIANILVSFISKCNSEFNDRLKLNKLLFYTDFVNYKLSGSSITGLSYRAIDYGPVPSCYENIYNYFENENIINSKWIRDSNGAAKETFITNLEFDESIFTAEEKQIIEIIAEKFNNTPTWDLVDLSHAEQGWIDLHIKRELINYQQYAFDLRAI